MRVVLDLKVVVYRLVLERQILLPEREAVRRNAGAERADQYDGDAAGDGLFALEYEVRNADGGQHAGEDQERGRSADGLVGVDAAEFFARRNAKVTMVEMADEIGRELDPINRCAFKELAEQKNIRLLTGTKLLEVKDGSFIVDTGAETQELDFDYGMVCMGMAPVITLDEPLREYCLENGIEYANIGDSKKTRKIINGVQEGRNVLKILEKMEILH